MARPSAPDRNFLQILADAAAAAEAETPPQKKRGGEDVARQQQPPKRPRLVGPPIATQPSSGTTVAAVARRESIDELEKKAQNAAPIRIAVVGSSRVNLTDRTGVATERPRGDELFARMVDAVRKQIAVIVQRAGGDPTAPVIIVSGGSAWSDHIAVRLFADGQGWIQGRRVYLEIHLPCKWDTDANEFVDSRSAALLNARHAVFSRVCKFYSLRELGRILASDSPHVKLGMVRICDYHPNCPKRNAHIVASCAYLIALSTYNKKQPGKPGSPGTLYTWDMAEGTGVVRYFLPIPQIARRNPE